MDKGCYSVDGEIQDHDLIFSWSDGKQLRSKLYDEIVWKPALADGVNIKELSEYLGHHDPGFTLQTYTHMLPSTGGWREVLCG